MARKETIGESRLQIKDSTFETVYNNLFTQDLCVTVFSRFSLKKPRRTHSRVAIPSSKNTRNTTWRPFSATIRPARGVKSHIWTLHWMPPKWRLCWCKAWSWRHITCFLGKITADQRFEQAVLLWDRELILQTERIIASNHKTTLYLCIAEVVVYLILALLTLFYLYPRLKRGVLYSLSFLLLIPFHIFKENEMFSTFLKKKVKFSGMI